MSEQKYMKIIKKMFLMFSVGLIVHAKKRHKPSNSQDCTMLDSLPVSNGEMT